MSMTYQEFKDYIVISLWRTGDTQLIANLDNLIRQANAELGRRLKPEVRQTSTTFSSALSVALPSDYHALRAVTGEGIGEILYVTPARLRVLREFYANKSWLSVYSLQGSNILFAGPVADPIDITIDYERKIPDYATTDSSWIEEEYLDIYLNCVSKQAAPFLREDERLQTWMSLLNEGIEQANADAAFNISRGIHSSKPLPRQASVSRKGRVH